MPFKQVFFTGFRAAPISSRGWLWAAVFLLAALIRPFPAQAENGAPALTSLQSYTGIWQMPNARVLPDWHIRLKYGMDEPYHYYGGALGIWDRLELHGQFTRVETLQGFVGEGYGDYKDRAAGGRLVLIKEDDFWPQVAVGAFDATGTALFGTRYLVASKLFGNFDITFGLGQGILAGEFVPDTVRADEQDRAFAFLASDPLRRTRPFAGLEWHFSPQWTFSAEYSSLDRQNMVGYRDGVLDDTSRTPINLGLKYRLTPKTHLQMAVMGADAIAGGISAELPLDPEGFLTWKKVFVADPGEGPRWQAHQADNPELARLLGERLQEEGFTQVAVAVSAEAVWIEAANFLHLSSARALGHLATVADSLLPERIGTFYLNLKQHGMVTQSLRASRVLLRDYLAGRQERDNFLQFAQLDLHADRHWQEFRGLNQATERASIHADRLSYSVNPKIKTFLNNRKGFFKHKGVVQTRANYRLWPGADLSGELEIPFFNQFDELAYSALERDAVRTDLVEYEKQSETRLSMLSLNQSLNLPGSVMGRFSAGLFESAYAGFGAEVFRYFHDGLWGVGLEGATVRKRDVDDNFALRDEQPHWYTNAFVNLYTQLWPGQGLEGGLKLGRFLAGDPGVRFELRRSHKYFTIGGWYTMTDTSDFTAEENRGNREKGVYISLPLALFKNSDIPGHLRYLITSFTLDPGQSVRQPGSLYPMDPWATPVHTRSTLDDMRIR